MNLDPTIAAYLTQKARDDETVIFSTERLRRLVAELYPNAFRTLTLERWLESFGLSSILPRHAVDLICEKVFPGFFPYTQRAEVNYWVHTLLEHRITPEQFRDGLARLTFRQHAHESATFLKKQRLEKFAEFYGKIDGFLAEKGLHGKSVENNLAGKKFSLCHCHWLNSFLDRELQKVGQRCELNFVEAVDRKAPAVFDFARTSCYEATTPTEEAQNMLAHIAQRVEAGLPLERCALILADQKRYRPLVEREQRRFGSNFMFSFGAPLGEEPAGIFLKGIFAFVRDDAALSAHARTEFCRAFSLSQQLLDEFLAIRRASFNDWVDICENLLMRLNLADEDLVASLKEFWGGMKVSAILSEDLTRETFVQFCLRPALQSPHLSRLSTGQESVDVLPVLTLDEARGLAFDQVWILGCVEGQLPRRLPQDMIFDEMLKKILQLPTQMDAERREDHTLALLARNAASLTMSYPRRVQGALAQRSRYVEFALAADAEMLELSTRARVFSTARPLVKEGASFAVDETFSVSQAETFLQCPYRWMMQLRHRKSFVIPGEKHPSELGVLLHDIIDQFLGWLSAQKDAVSCEDVFDLAVGKLASLTWERTRDFNDLALEEHLVRTSWPALCAMIFGLKGLKWATLERICHEEEFSFVDPILNKTFVGRIDCALVYRDEVRMIDFKTKNHPPKSQVYGGFKPQLTLYAQAWSVQKPTSVGYWDILDGAYTEVFDRDGVKLEKACENFHEFFQKRLETTLQGEGRAYGDASFCKECEWSVACRRDDPRARHFAQQKRAKEWLISG